MRSEGRYLLVEEQELSTADGLRLEGNRFEF
jgi:hypothetical protein